MVSNCDDVVGIAAVWHGLAQRELMDVGVALTELRASVEVLHVSLVNLLGLQCDGLAVVSIQLVRPHLEGLA
jgi:hypothetical protein